MATSLFNKIIYGPVHSRRLGVSLGVNLLPVDAKTCTFNCLYCECGLNTALNSSLPTPEEVKEQLCVTLARIANEGKTLDVITFAGNGEPTMHPDFEEIIDETITLRNTSYPKMKISVLSNSTLIHKPKIFSALNKVDYNILKMDSAIDSTIKLLNQPASASFSRNWLVEHLKKFNGNLIIQTLFLRGTVKDQVIDNTTEEEISAWIAALKEIKPKQVMVYSIDRDTPVNTLEKVTEKELFIIAEKVKKLNIPVIVTA